MSGRMVIDASVAAKWFLKDPSETDIDLADDVLVALLAGDLEIHAPRIFTYEVCGLLTKACQTHDRQTRLPRVTKPLAVASIRELFGLPIHLSEATEEEGAQALEMAVDYSKQHYDMTYVRLAENLDCQWCTADGKALEGIPRSFPRHRVLLLSSLREAL